MIHQYISHDSANRRLIIIFSGWSTVPEFYSRLHAPGWDIALIHDYTDFSLNTSFASGYSTIYVVAWSLGVAAAEYAASAFASAGIRVAGAFAINGTPLPVSDSYGIPEYIFTTTERTLTTRNLAKFKKRMSSRGDIYRLPVSDDSESDKSCRTDFLKTELRAFQTGCESQSYSATQTPRLPWRRVYIGISDLIFPSANQINAWNTMAPEAQQIKIPTGHYIPLQRVLKDIIPNTSDIAEHFSRASHTYEKNAEAQAAIAGHLASLIPSDIQDKPAEILEIGAGSGLFTRKIAEKLNLYKATFVDLYPTQRFNVAEFEKYVAADAESWIEECPDNSFDLIVSANTIQWFADTEAFVANAARVLRPGGILLCSTFIKGHFAELESLRPSPLILKSESEIRRMLTPLFTDIHIEENPVTLTFPNAAALITHLKDTGINGASIPGADLSRSAIKNFLQSLPANPTLTYKPLYIRVRKKTT